MKRSPFSPIKHPGVRAEAISSLERSGMDKGLVEMMRESMTPPVLRDLPDSFHRGHKSCGRIQQIQKRRRFKVRTQV